MVRAIALVLSAWLCAWASPGIAQPRQTEGAGGVALDESQAPIDNLFEAWRGLDTRLYINQWSSGATKFDNKTGARQGTSALLADRTRLFGQLSNVEVEYSLTLLHASEQEATYRVAYTLRFRYRDGRTVLDSACETYRVRSRNGVWLIVENIDYVSCDVRPNETGRQVTTPAERSCEDLWRQRNSIYAQYGFCFKQARSIAVFGRGCFPPYGELPPSTKADVDRIIEAEASQRCPR